MNIRSDEQTNSEVQRTISVYRRLATSSQPHQGAAQAHQQSHDSLNREKPAACAVNHCPQRGGLLHPE